jgi:tRNA (uracil-5-)-methyltransferase
VAVVDPPRAGLHNDVIKALRACLPLQRILFVSCHAPAFVRNAIGFCRPTSRAFEGEPFTPTQAFAIDLFPDTEHCELVVVLERQGMAQSKRDEARERAVPTQSSKSDEGREGQVPAQSEPTDAQAGEEPAAVGTAPSLGAEVSSTESGEQSANNCQASSESAQAFPTGEAVSR